MAELEYVLGLGPSSRKGLRVRISPKALLNIMIKIKNILRSIKIEEYILFIFSLVLISAYFILNGLKSGFTDFFDYGFKHLAIGVKYFSFVFLLFIFIFFINFIYI